MAFLIGSSTVINNSRQMYSGESNAPYANLMGYFNSSSWRLDDLYRYTTYTDDLGNCRGYLPGGNCNGNGAWTAPNGNWWTWGATGLPGLCGNPGAWNGAVTNAYYAVNVALIYDGYYELYNRVRGSEQHRGYGHCNCNSGYNSVGNCRSNCNCNCNC
jgi:hypothetical protein